MHLLIAAGSLLLIGLLQQILRTPRPLRFGSLLLLNILSLKVGVSFSYLALVNFLGT
jgi:hypothetical protein